MQGGYEELTGWYDFHARQYDAALGRWFGVDAYAHSMSDVSPFSAMANNPVMFVDPDGNEPITLAILGIAMLKAAGIGAGMSAVSYAASTAISGQSWNWGQFASQVGKGAAIGGLTAGAGLGFSAGLNAMGVGVQASNFIGGALGSFAGTLAGGGMPQSPIEWATALGSAAMTGNAFMKSNPLRLENGFGVVDMDLPEVIVSAGRMRGAGWWGMTNDFLEGGGVAGIANEVLINFKGSWIYQDELPLSSGATYPNYSLESFAIGGMGTGKLIGSVATKGSSFGQKLFLSEKFGITSTRFGNSAANAQGALNQGGGLIKAGWSTGTNSAGQWGYKFRVGIASSSANPNISRFHMYVPKSFVPNSFANPSIQVKRSLFNLGL